MSRIVPSWRDDFKPLIRLGLPLIGTSVMGFLMVMIDSLMLGWYNVTSLAAASIAGSYFFILFTLGAGVGYAVMPIVAAASAVQDEVRVRRVTRMAFWWAIVCFAIAFPLFFYSGKILLLMGQEEQIAAEGQMYLRIMWITLLPAMLANVLRSFLSALDRTAVLVWSTVAAVALNGVVNYLLIFGNYGFPELGIRGAAIASCSVQTLMMVIMAVYANWRLPAYSLYQRLWKPDREVFFEIARLGFPIGLTSVAEVGLFSAAAVMMGWIGEVELAAHGIALQLAGLTFMFHIGMSQAATIRCGAKYAHKDEVGLRRTAYASLAIALAFAVCVVTMFLTVPSHLVGIFIDPADPRADAVIATGVTLVYLAALFQFVDAGQVTAIGVLRGVQDTNVPMWLATVSYWIIGLPASYVMGFVFGWQQTGIWLGLTVGLGAAAVSLMIRFWTKSVKIGETVVAEPV